MNPLTRTRTITWEDPSRTAEASKTMSGLELLRAISSGELPHPPILVLMGINGIDVREGRVAFKVVPAEYHYNPLGVVHGGLAATVLDSAMGCAVQSTLPLGMGFTTLELKINLVRPLTSDTGEVEGVGTVMYRGGRTATAEARLTDQTGKLYAHATSTCLLMSV